MNIYYPWDTLCARLKKNPTGTSSVIRFSPAVASSFKPDYDLCNAAAKHHPNNAQATTFAK
jgi:hypothetical protein